MWRVQCVGSVSEVSRWSVSMYDAGMVRGGVHGMAVFVVRQKGKAFQVDWTDLKRSGWF